MNENSNFEPVSADTITKVSAFFSKMGCAQLQDACKGSTRQKFGIRLPASLRPVAGPKKTCGPVYPVNTDNDMLPGLAALCRAPRGYIILINNLAADSEALAGDLFTTDAIAGGFSGLVVNGAVRDTGQLKEMPLPIFAKQVNFVSAGTGTTSPRTPETVTLDAIVIEPNDWIFADDDGLFLVRGRYLRYILAGAAVVYNREEELRQKINPNQRLATLCGIQDYLSGDGKLGFAV